MKNEKFVECTDCGRKILVCNAHYIKGKPYGYSCYKKQLALLKKQWENEKNLEYMAECFAAMQVFDGKRSNTFHDSICKQWEECKKLTAKQLNCIIRGFTLKEEIKFWINWQLLTNDECLKWSVPEWIVSKVPDYTCYIDDEVFINCLLYDKRYKKYGFYFYTDEDCPGVVRIRERGKDDIELKEHMEYEEIEIIKVVDGEANKKN